MFSGEFRKMCRSVHTTVAIIRIYMHRGSFKHSVNCLSLEPKQYRKKSSKQNNVSMTQIKRLFSVILYFNGIRFVCVGVAYEFIYIYIYCGFTPSGMCYNVCSTVRKIFIGFLLFRVPTRFCDVPSLLAATHYHHSWSKATAQHSAAMLQ